MKRLVLVDRASNRVCGDTSAPGPYAQLWSEIACHLDDDIAVLSASAARLLDQSLGRTAGEYVFSPFAADQDSGGYLIFDCSRSKGSAAPLIATETLDPDAATYSVMTRCTYVGYVRRKH